MKRINLKSIYFICIFLIIINICGFVYADHWYDDLDWFSDTDGTVLPKGGAINTISNNPELYSESVLSEDISKLSKEKRLFYIAAADAIINSPKIMNTEDANAYGVPDIKKKRDEVKSLVDLTEKEKEAIKNSEKKTEEKETAIKETDIGEKAIREGKTYEDAKAEVEETSKNYIYKQPGLNDSNTSTTDTIDGIVTDGRDFISSGKDSEPVSSEEIQKFSQTLYNILITIAIAVSVIIGGILGIKLMTSSAEEKAEVKQFLLPYVMGCIVVFGAFGIWKLVVTILQNTNI